MLLAYAPTDSLWKKRVVWVGLHFIAGMDLKILIEENGKVLKIWEWGGKLKGLEMKHENLIDRYLCSDFIHSKLWSL